MRLIRDLEDFSAEYRSGAVTIGNFDGVHRGHARIMSRLVEMARRVGGPATVFTFDPHPVRLLRPAMAPPPLTWTDRKAQLLSRLGIDIVVAYPTSEALLQLSPEQFFQQLIRDALGARGLAEGPNFCFGKDRAGTVGELQAFCDRDGIELDVIEPLMEDGDYVSSSRIRRLIAAGKLSEAGELLTEPYRVRGLVTHGAGRGASLGFATANIEGIDTLVPAHGVYAGAIECDGQTWPAAVNVGPNPTFGERAIKFEVHLVGYRGTLYGQPLEVDMLARIRDIQNFETPEALIKQLHRDVAAVQSVVDRLPKRPTR